MVVVLITFSLFQNKKVACINHRRITCHMIRFTCFCFGRGNVPHNLFWVLQKRSELFQFSFSLSIQKAVLCLYQSWSSLTCLLSFQNKPRYCCQGNRRISCFWVLQKLHFSSCAMVLSCFLFLPKLFDQLFACFSVFLFTYVFLSFQNKPRYCCQGKSSYKLFWVLQKLHHEQLFYVLSCFLLLPKLFDQLFACFSVFLFAYVFCLSKANPVIAVKEIVV